MSYDEVPPPFGKPFKYTDPNELSTSMDRKPRWYKRWSKKKKDSVAWAVSENSKMAQAYIDHTRNKEVKVSPLNPKFCVPVTSSNVLLAAENVPNDKLA